LPSIATILERSENECQVDHHHPVENLVKIGPIHSKIIVGLIKTKSSDVVIGVSFTTVDNE